MSRGKLAQKWRKAAEDLRLDIVTPFSLALPSGAEVNVELLLRQFGAPKGMLIAARGDQICAFSDEIFAEGYGYSVMSEPEDPEAYSREDLIEVLVDWGWSGPDTEKPSWLRTPPDVVDEAD